MNVLVIQITGADLVLARFSVNRQRLSFLHGFRRAMPDDGSLAPLLESSGPRQAGERVILSLPSALAHGRELSIPISDRRKLREILPLELAGEIACDAGELVFDALPAGEGRALAVWCRKSDVGRLVADLALCGLEPEVVTTAHLHWNLLLPASAALTAVTDGAALFIGDHKAPLMVRHLSPGDFRQETERSVAAFELAGGGQVQTRLLIGAVKEHTASLSQELSDAFSGDSAAALDLASAYGVARAFVAGQLVNFRTGDLSYTRRERELFKRLRITSLLALILVALLFGELAVRYWLASRDIDSLDRSIGSIYREIFPSRTRPVEPVGEVRAELRRMGQDGPAHKVLPLLKGVAELKGVDIAGFYEIEIDGGSVRLKGDARSAQSAYDFKARSASLFTNPEVSELKSRSDGGISFVFRGIAGEVRR